MSRQINLISPQLLKKRYAFGVREMALGAGVVLVLMLAWGGYRDVQVRALEAQAAAEEARVAEAQAELDRLSAAAGRPSSALLAERIAAVGTEVAQREAVLAAITARLDRSTQGFSARMRALAFSDTEGLWLDAFTLAPDHVALKGSVLEASHLTTYLDRLGRQGPFAGLSFSGLEAARAEAAKGEAGAAAPERIDFELVSGGVEPPAPAGEAR